MRLPRPPSLSENAGLFFVGEHLLPAAILHKSAAERMLTERNTHGKPNADVLRPIATSTKIDHFGAQWLIDFPNEMNETEASLYAAPFQHLRRITRSKSGRWWTNSGAAKNLRTAITRRERYLAVPIKSEIPVFQWLDSAFIPDDTFLVVARDDDFARGILQSDLFAAWWRRFHSAKAPTDALDSFAFPWSPGTSLNALSSAQEEQRHAVARADRSDQAMPRNEAACACYGFSADLSESELLLELWNLSHRRAGVTAPSFKTEKPRANHARGRKNPNETI